LVFQYRVERLKRMAWVREDQPKGYPVGRAMGEPSTYVREKKKRKGKKKMQSATA
jgi:hypothetical protein